MPVASLFFSMMNKFDEKFAFVLVIVDLFLLKTINKFDFFMIWKCLWKVEEK